MSPTTEALMKVAPLRAKRMAKELSLRELAKMVGVSRQAIANYENAINNPSQEIWEKLKDVLDLGGAFEDYFEEKNSKGGRPRLWDGKDCAFEGCTRKPFSKGLCTVHYNQHRKGKPLKKIGESRRKYGETCVYPGCVEPHRAMGYCNTHYHQILRGDKPHSIKARQSYPEGSICNVSKCKEKPHAKGLCEEHYRALQNKRKKIIKKEESC